MFFQGPEYSSHLLNEVSSPTLEKGKYGSSTNIQQWRPLARSTIASHSLIPYSQGPYHNSQAPFIPGTTFQKTQQMRCIHSHHFSLLSSEKALAVWNKLLPFSLTIGWLVAFTVPIFIQTEESPQ